MPSRAPDPSALESLLKTHRPPSLSPDETALHHLALQIAHNLKHNHSWTSLRLHYPPPPSNQHTSTAMPTRRPLLSGLPPKRLYVHPDEQIAYLQRQHEASSSGGGGEGKNAAPALADANELPPEREWVLPGHLRERWSLRLMAGVFDSVSRCVPPGDGDGDVREDGEGVLFDEDEDEGMEGDSGESNEWRIKMPKRLLMAILEDDSTVVYYVVHDGVVKPRQN